MGVGGEGKRKIFLVFSLLHSETLTKILILEISSAVEVDLQYQTHVKKKMYNEMENQNPRERKPEEKIHIPQIRLESVHRKTCIHVRLLPFVHTKGVCSRYLHDNTFLSGLFLTV